MSEDIEPIRTLAEREAHERVVFYGTTLCVLSVVVILMVVFQRV